MTGKYGIQSLGVRVESGTAPEPVLNPETQTGYRDNPLLAEIAGLKSQLSIANSLKVHAERLLEEQREAYRTLQNDISWRKARLSTTIARLAVWFGVVPLWFAFNLFMLVAPVVMVMKYHYRIDNLIVSVIGVISMIVFGVNMHNASK